MWKNVHFKKDFMSFMIFLLIILFKLKIVVWSINCYFLNILLRNLKKIRNICHTVEILLNNWQREVKEIIKEQKLTYRQNCQLLFNIIYFKADNKHRIIWCLSFPSGVNPSELGYY